MKMDAWLLSCKGEIYNPIHTHKTTTQDLARPKIVFATPNRWMNINDLVRHEWYNVCTTDTSDYYEHLVTKLNRRTSIYYIRLQWLFSLNVHNATSVMNINYENEAQTPMWPFMLFRLFHSDLYSLRSNIPNGFFI